MRIQYCSDLHLEFAQNSNYLLNNPLHKKGDILILAGDITPMQYEFFNNSFFNFISAQYTKVFWVPGNHEYYYSDIAKYNKSIHSQLHNNISIVNNVTIEIDDIQFIFTTLWSKIAPENKHAIEERIADFSSISINNRNLKVNDYNQLHAQCLSFLTESLINRKRKSIVVSHHIPSPLCSSNEHRKNSLNEAFYVDLTKLIKESGPNFWIYGHSHYNKPPVQLGNTILLTNQLGYLKLDENLGFNHGAYFSI